MGGRPPIIESKPNPNHGMGFRFDGSGKHQGQWRVACTRFEQSEAFLVLNLSGVVPSTLNLQHSTFFFFFITLKPRVE